MILLSVWAVMIAGEWYVAALALQSVRTKYPWFTSLVSYMAVKSLILFYVRTQLPGFYFHAYYRSEMLAGILQLGATVEVFSVMFRPFWTVPKKSLATLILATTLSLAVVAHANVVLSPFSGEVAFYQSMDRVVSFTVAISLAAAMLFGNYFEMPMRSRIKGIALGLYVMAVTDVVMSLVISNFRGFLANSLAFLPVVAHYSTLTIWIAYVGRPETLVAVVHPSDIPLLIKVRSAFRLALSNAPIPCVLTIRKPMGKARGEQKAKTVNKNG